MEVERRSNHSCNESLLVAVSASVMVYYVCIVDVDEIDLRSTTPYAAGVHHGDRHAGSGTTGECSARTLSTAGGGVEQSYWSLLLSGHRQQSVLLTSRLHVTDTRPPPPTYTQAVCDVILYVIHCHHVTWHSAVANNSICTWARFTKDLKMILRLPYDILSPEVTTNLWQT